MRDNHPKRRQHSRDQGKLERRKANRQELPAILIVCEGRETEPNYIEGLCNAYRINLANVHVLRGTTATDVTALVRRAKGHFERDRDYDRVFVVFDDDGQPLDRARQLAQKTLKTASGKTICIEMISSKPCFEYWLLLHFEFSTRPFSAATDVIDALKAHLSDYDKANNKIFLQVSSGLDNARAHAVRVQQQLASTGAVSPNTNMGQVIDALMALSMH